jgi:hypothetical protein
VIGTEALQLKGVQSLKVVSTVIAVKRRKLERQENFKIKGKPAFAGLSLARSAGLEPAAF